LEGKRTARATEVDQISEALSNLAILEPTTNNIQNNVDILYTNADCFNNKKKDLEILLQTLPKKPDVIVITEVNPKKMVVGLQENEFNLCDYNLFTLNIGKNNCRGIIIYVKINLSASEVEINSTFSECLFIKIRLVDGNDLGLTIGAFYRSPTGNISNDKKLIDLMRKINTIISGKFILLGDFNLSNINWLNFTTSTGPNSLDSKFLDSLKNNFLTQHVFFPTRARGNDTPHTLDLIISNGDFVSDVANLSPLGKSDHSVIVCCCKLKIETSYRAPKFRFERGDYDGFCCDVENNLSNYAIPSKLEINQSWVHVKNVIQNAAVKFIPLTSCDYWKKKDTWKNPIPSDTRKLIKKKHRLWTKYQETRDRAVEAQYKQIRNQVRRETRKINKKIQNDIAKTCKQNPKKFWQFVNSKNKSSRSIGSITVTDSSGISRKTENDLEKAEAFSDHFQKIFTKEPVFDLADQIPLVTTAGMEMITFSEENIYNRLAKLKCNKSPGPDLLHSRLLNELKNVIPGVLKDIFEASYEHGVLPEDWKSSIISTVFKKGKKHLVENYRPISLTCITCKIMESVIRDQMMDYFLSNKLFNNYQYGFIKGRSVVLQLLKIIDDWLINLENGNQIDIIYTDFEKAFDKVPHKRLLNKLMSYKVDVKLIAWIEAFLCNRTQQVRVNGILSKSQSVLSGIPQGTVLGPLLFIIFINDLPEVCKNLSDIFLFADDAKLYKSISDMSDCQKLNDSGQHFFDWSEKWCMKLNVDKCKVLSVKRKDDIKFAYGFNKCGDCFVLEHVDHITDLGVTIDNDLCFDLHISEKINKAFQMLGIINRTFVDIDETTFLLLYKTMVRSHLEFAGSVWNPYKLNQIKNLEKVQKRATKLVRSCKLLSYRDRLIHLKLPTLKFRRLRGDMIEVFKILNNYYDESSVPNLPRNFDTRTRGNSLKLMHIRSRLDQRKFSFCSRVVGYWNSLPDYVVRASSVNMFKNSLDKFWIKEEMYYNFEANISCTCN